MPLGSSGRGRVLGLMGSSSADVWASPASLRGRAKMAFHSSLTPQQTSVATSQCPF